jgi:hypothetical protein
VILGVAVRDIDLPIAREFFELFKTPWEPYVPGRQYRAVLDATGAMRTVDAGLVIAYGCEEQPVDRASGIRAGTDGSVREVGWEGRRLPIYGAAARFSGISESCLLSRQPWPLGYRQRERDRTVVRVGYDLFGEVRYLLTSGQPANRADIPTLDLHIELLRTLLLESDVSFVEIPPQPAGYECVCCLTHDIDFVGIRRHAMDQTLAGFSVRASVGTLTDVLGGRRPAGDLLRNGTALASLPLVFSGVLPDLWRPFEDYLGADDGRPSTYFVIPFRNRPGVSPSGAVEPRRAAPYEIPEISEELRMVAARGQELAVHGIDAWRDVEAGRAELARLTAVSGGSAPGVRMHWLYFDGDSPRRLEQAGFAYDSTWGYNDAVGYRAGTTQPFRFPGCEALMELPLAIMDTAMFYPDRMGLSQNEALSRCGRIVDHACAAGGTVVVNWHDRSLAPERLWGPTYAALLETIGDRAWFATAADAVGWFRWRRAIRFQAGSDALTLEIPAAAHGGPPARLRTHRPGQPPGEQALDACGTLAVRL